MTIKKIQIAPGNTIDVWPSSLGVGIEIESGEDSAGAFLTPDQVDDLIRALGAARVELSKARPQS